MPGLDTGSLDRRVMIERPVADDSYDGAGSGTWEYVDTVWASVQDVLPSRAERLAEGINVTTRPARIRMRYRPDITASMRIISDARIMQIIAGPAVMGNRDGLELMVEEYSPAGGGA